MARALILNAGSSTLKWAILDASGAEGPSGTETWAHPELPRRAEQIRARLEGAGRFDAVGHRVTHGGTIYRDAIRLDAAARARLAEVEELDALHMQPALAGVDAALAAFPELPQIAVFDTAFHATMPEAATSYALPRDWTERWGLRRFGFHGLSVAWSVARVAELAGGLPGRLVVCHLGSGCSVTAVRDGRSADTSMGFSPVEGLVMATRSGSVDPGLVLHLLLHRGMQPAALLADLNERSGLLGVSGVSGDLRKVLAAADAGDAHARLAYEQFVLSLLRAAGAAIAVLGGLDALVFTGGIGENSGRVRGAVAAALGFAGVAIDPAIETGGDVEISAAGARARAFVVHAREDRVILAEVARLLGW